MAKNVSELTFNELSAYLTEHSVFGFTATRRKKTIIYTFKRYYIGLKLFIKVKVDKHTKHVISVLKDDKTYTDFDEIKKMVEK
jgi:hypothetical protein